MTCRTCKFLHVQPDVSGKIVPRKQNVYPCLAPEPDLSKLPKSITGYYRFKLPLARVKMQPDDGEGCPVYSVRQKEPMP